MSAVVDFPVKPEARDYLARFARNANEPGWLASRRQQAMTRFAELGFPSRRSEGWRYLDLQPLERRPLLPVGQGTASDAAELRERLARLTLSDAPNRLVLVDGRFVAELSTVEPRPGIWFGSTAQAMRDRPEALQAAMEGIAGDAAHPFAALNAAFFSDGFILDIAPGVSLDRPIEIVHLGAGINEGSFHTRSVVMLGEDSRAGVVETYAGEGRYWRNDVIGILLGDRSELTHTVLVEEAVEAIHLAQIEARLGDGAHFTGFALLLTGQRVRHETNVEMGEGAHCEINGAYLVTGSDEANIVTTVDHREPGGQTSELIKGVAAERGHGAFQGRMIVREDAQKTDAHQLSRNLIIGQRAVIDTKPELEIYADDVKCSHGASVGDLDETALFYLETRGIPVEEARRMLIEGFLREAVDEVADLAVREHLQQRLAARLAKLES